MKRLKVLLLASMIPFVLSNCGGGGGGGGAPPSGGKDITAFSIMSPAATGMIGRSANTILVNVPAGTDVTALVATFSTTGSSVKVGGTAQVSGVTPNDFTTPVIYTVKAADGTTRNYLVTVRAGALPPQWARTVTAGSSMSLFNGLSAASEGAVYAVGEIYGTVTFDFGNSATATGVYNGGNILLVKYDRSGVAQWARTVMSGSDFTSFAGAFAAPDGAVYAAGFIAGTGVFDFGNSVTTAGTFTDTNIVLVKYDGSGAAQWARTVVSGSDSSLFTSVSAAADGSVYAAGYMDGTGTYDFGNGVTAAGTYSGNNSIIVKYDSSGAAQWARTVVSGSDFSSFTSVSAAADGSVYAAGYMDGTGTYDFGNGVTAAGAFSGDNVVLVKYNSSGAAQWARTVTAGSSNSGFNSVAVSTDGSVYAAGTIYGTGTCDFGNSVTVAGPSAVYHIVLVKYSSSGAAQWARTVTAGTGDSWFLGVSAASDGSVHAAGVISGTGTYDFGDTVAAAGPYSQQNSILVKYDSSGAAQWSRTATAGTNHSRFDGISVAADGSVYAAGQIHGTGTFDFGNSITAAGTYITNNIVLVKYY